MCLFGCLVLALSRRPTRERGQEKGFKCKEKVRVSYCRKNGVLGSGEGIGSLGDKGAPVEGWLWGSGGAA